MNKAKKIMLCVAMVTCIFSMTSCHRVEPGYVSIKVSMTGTEKGEIDVLTTGRHGINPITEECHDFPTFTVNTVYQNDEESGRNEEFVFQSSEGMKVEADIGVSYYFDEEKIVTLYKTYRQGPEEIRNVVVKNSVRDSFNKIGSRYVVDDIIGAKKEDIINEVYNDVKTKLEPYGINIQTISWYNPPRPPQSVIDALNLKVEASQKALQIENEVAQTEAEAQKKRIEIDVLNYQKTSSAEADAEAIKLKARAEADAILAKMEAEAEGNKKLAESITNELIEYSRINNWDGANPKIVGADSQAIIVTP